MGEKDRERSALELRMIAKVKTITKDQIVAGELQVKKPDEKKA